MAVLRGDWMQRQSSTEKPELVAPASTHSSTKGCSESAPFQHWASAYLPVKVGKPTLSLIHWNTYYLLLLWVIAAGNTMAGQQDHSPVQLLIPFCWIVVWVEGTNSKKGFPIVVRTLLLASHSVRSKCLTTACLALVLSVGDLQLGGGCGTVLTFC